ncbi:hypothetical protein TDB9533_00487 [Thalassocella blandensis]|nr:hypothetical protein TDB9533_00487 [Thalassocella blandensis]
MKIITAVALFLFSVQVFAGYSGIKYEGEVSYSNGALSFKKKVDAEEFKPIVKKAEELMRIEDTLYAKTKAEIRQLIAGQASLKSYKFEFDGPYVLRLEGKPNGDVRIRVGGFKIYAKAVAKKSFYVEAEVKVTSNTVWLEGDYDPYTGKIDNVSLDPSVKINTSTDVDTILGIDIDFLLNLFGVDLEKDLSSLLDQQINELEAYEDTIFGLNSHIPTGVYVVNGVDWGVVMVDEIRNILSGESIEISLSDQLISSHVWNTIEINFSDRLNFIINELPERYTPEPCIPGRICEIEP